MNKVHFIINFTHFKIDSFSNRRFIRPYSYSRYWTGTSSQWRLMRENIIKKSFMSFAFEKITCISLHCKLVPVQYREFNVELILWPVPMTRILGYTRQKMRITLVLQRREKTRYTRLGYDSEIMKENTSLQRSSSKSREKFRREFVSFSLKLLTKRGSNYTRLLIQ